MNRTSQSWIAVLGLLLGCTENRTLGVPCAFNTDCVDPQICAGGFCRAQCHGNRDCPPSWICAQADQPGKNVCVQQGSIALCVSGDVGPSGTSPTSMPNQSCMNA